MGIGAFTSAAVSFFSNHTAIPMTMIMVICAITAFSILLIGRFIIHNKATIADVEEEAADMWSTT